MFKRTVQTVAFAQASSAQYMSPYDDLMAIEFEQIFENALPQKSDDPAYLSGRSAADSDLVERATSRANTDGAIVNSVIDSFRLAHHDSRPTFDSNVQTEAESIPNCNSFECKNGMVSGGPDNNNEAVPENWGQ